MQKPLKRSAYALIVLVLSLLPVSQLAAFHQQDSKLKSFVAQYRALRSEGIDLWRSAQTADLTQDAHLLSAQREILNYRKRLQALAQGIQGYIIQLLREQQSSGRYSDNDNRFLAVARAADTLDNLLGFASDYLDTKQPMYLRVALKYEEAWRVIDEVVGN